MVSDSCAREIVEYLVHEDEIFIKQYNGTYFYMRRFKRNGE